MQQVVQDLTSLSTFSHQLSASQVQIIDRVVDVPVTKERMVPMVSTVQKTVEIPQVLHDENAQLQWS